MNSLCEELGLETCYNCKHSIGCRYLCYIEEYKNLILKNISKNEIKRLFHITYELDMQDNKQDLMCCLKYTIYTFHPQYTDFINTLILLK